MRVCVCVCVLPDMWAGGKEGTCVCVYMCMCVYVFVYFQVCGRVGERKHECVYVYVCVYILPGM